MAVNLSPVGGVAGQFFDNNGDPLVGGKLYTYAAGTTTPQATYTSSSGATANSNPIILNAGGRVPAEIWLTDGLVYKFVLYSSTDQLIGSWDNIVGINSNFVNFVTSEEVQTATAGQTVFTLTTMTYQPGINNLVVYVDGVNQVEGGSYSFVETNSTTVTFTSGLHLGAVVKFVSAETVTTIGSNAAQVAYEPAGSGAVTTTVQAKLRETVSVKDFGAVGDGVTDDTAAFVAALAASNYVLVPSGTYVISAQIDITGDKVITGPINGSGDHPQPAVINFTAASGNCFSATSAQFGGIAIMNLAIHGGNGEYAIRSSRPQSQFINIEMETFNGGGIQLFEAGTGSQASWSTLIKDCKWVAPASPTPYRGYDITINGGHVTLDGCTAIRGSMGINVNQGEAINIYRCSVNLQTNTVTYPYSSLTADNQCGIRLSGGGYKMAVAIKNSYIEACTYGIYVEKCESLTIEDNYIADVGIGSNYASLLLKDSVITENNVKNVTIRNNTFNDSGNNMTSIDIGDRCSNVMVINNWIKTNGTNGVCITKGTGFYSYIQNNYFQPNAFTGANYSDPEFLLVDLDYQTNGFHTYRRRNFDSADNTWYDLGAVGNNQIWRIAITDANDPATWRFAQDLYISATGVATFETIYNVQAGYAVRQLQVSGGIIQFRTTSAGGATANTVTAMRIA